MKERDLILQRTNGGYSIFKHYLGDCVTKNLFRNPFRDDASPSCKLRCYNRKGSVLWYMIDYGDSTWCGDAFAIIGKSKSLVSISDFPELLRIIDRDMCLCIFDMVSGSTSDRHPVTYAPPPVKERHGSSLDFSPSYKPFWSWEKKYWQRYGISPSVLGRYDVKSIARCVFIRKDGSTFTVHSSYNEPMYGYLFSEDSGFGIKCYRPFSKTRFLYAGVVPHPYVFGWHQLPSSGDHVFITGGEKDVLSLASHGFAAIALNSESASVSTDLLSDLASRFKHIIFLYDCDETGLRESALRYEEFKESFPVRRLVLPLAGNKSEKDVSDFFLKGHDAQELYNLIYGIV